MTLYFNLEKTDSAPISSSLLKILIEKSESSHLERREMYPIMSRRQKPLLSRNALITRTGLFQVATFSVSSWNHTVILKKTNSRLSQKAGVRMTHTISNLGHWEREWVPSPVPRTVSTFYELGHLFIGIKWRLEILLADKETLDGPILSKCASH